MRVRMVQNARRCDYIGKKLFALRLQDSNRRAIRKCAWNCPHYQDESEFHANAKRPSVASNKAIRRRFRSLSLQHYQYCSANFPALGRTPASRKGRTFNIQSGTRCRSAFISSQASSHSFGISIFYWSRVKGRISVRPSFHLAAPRLYPDRRGEPRRENLPNKKVTFLFTMATRSDCMRGT